MALNSGLSALKETPLSAAHHKLGARMVDFAGWNMPVQYQSIVAEHKAVRSSAGLFDVSHMGEFSISGAGAAEFVQHMIANDLEKLGAPNTALYTQFVNESGGTVDDLIVYRRDNDYFLVVNASNIDKDYAWLKKHLESFGSTASRGSKSSSDAVQLRNLSDATALLSLQGPNSVAVLAAAGFPKLESLSSFTLTRTSLSDLAVEIARTGYTGEDGFEIFVQSGHAERLWFALLKAGREFNIQPCGLGARDTLRLEAALPLYGHELDESTSPLEAGLGWSVKFNKKDFVGKTALEAQQSKGLQKKSVCLKCEGKALPRQGYRIFAGKTDSDSIGAVTSGSQGIQVGYPIAMAYVPPACTNSGQKLWMEIRDSRVLCEVVPRPFYKRSRKQ
jgi:aminomethyltransferase